RGPFWLGSISKLTRSPPARESKFTLESSPVRWKKYSRPSSAAMNPNPRSDTSFLMVPVGISNSSSRKHFHERTGPFEKIRRPRRTPPPAGRLFYLTSGFRGGQTSSERQQRDPQKGRRGARNLEPGGPPFAQTPDAPHRDRDHRCLA